MLRTGCILAVLVIFATCAVAQEISVRPGTQIPVELRTTIKSEASKLGEKLEFHTTEAVLIGNNIVVPEGATILGRIEKVLLSETGTPHSLVKIRLHTLKWKKNEAPLNAVIISVEPTPAQEMLAFRRRLFRDPPTFLNHIHIRAHLQQSASTDFYSDEPQFTVHKGLYFLLREIDPDHAPSMMGKDHTLDIGPPN